MSEQAGLVPFAGDHALAEREGRKSHRLGERRIGCVLCAAYWRDKEGWPLGDVQVLKLESEGRYVVRRIVPPHAVFGSGGEETVWVELGHEHDPDLPEWVRRGIQAFEEATGLGVGDASESGQPPVALDPISGLPEHVVGPIAGEIAGQPPEASDE